MSIFDKNIDALKKNNYKLVKEIIRAEEKSDYSQTELSKTGRTLPILKNGKHLHSKYDPLKEAERFFTGNENFVLFCGLGSGIHIEYFLNNFTTKACAVTDTDFANLKALFKIIDFSRILSNPNLYFLPPLESENFESEFINNYIPILHGNLEVKLLKPWEDFYKEKIPYFQAKIKNSLEKIKTDVSTQAVFGKIWMRNILLNLKTASLINPKRPKLDLNKSAYILGAGPSLEKALNTIIDKRSSLYLFVSDTAFSVLEAAGIEADFFVSIDPQNISYAHCFKPFTKNVIGIFDLCANPILPREFLQNGNSLFFTSGSHPFAQYAAQSSPFPYMETGGGTVALAAKSAAISLGFKDIYFAGLDFAYTDGKAYSNGTYLSKQFIKTADRFSNLETKFCDLMFRTSVKKIEKNGKITYTTELLEGYKSFFYSNDGALNKKLWGKKDFSIFPYNDFIKSLKQALKTNNPMFKRLFLPYFTYLSKKLSKNISDFADLELVLSEILEYTIN